MISLTCSTENGAGGLRFDSQRCGHETSGHFETCPAEAELRVIEQSMKGATSRTSLESGSLDAAAEIVPKDERISRHGIERAGNIIGHMSEMQGQVDRFTSSPCLGMVRGRHFTGLYGTGKRRSGDNAALAANDIPSRKEDPGFAASRYRDVGTATAKR